ncbi:MAG: hypothetical protein Q4F34_01895 [Prevotellaceae bacterium]|nr:hypothetical protein [Prevotellaceae bacterium]
MHSTYISESELKGAYSEGEASYIYNRVKSFDGDFLKFAKTFAHNDDYQVARNALWGLTKATDEELAQLQPMRDELIDFALNTDNQSIRRNALNIVNRLAIDEENIRTDLLDFCLEHMVQLDEYPSIQAVCMKIAHRICSFYPELADEMLRTVKAMDMEYYKPAVKSVVRRILSGKVK